MEKPTVELVNAAIDTLYHNQRVEGKEEASKWLDEFQKSLFAWELCDQLLHANRDPESMCFAAQTMKTKIQYHFLELPMTQHLSLRDSLLLHLEQHPDASNAVVAQLCLAVADHAVQCTQWVKPVTHLISRFSSKLEHFSILLEILTILPEEVSRECLHIGENRREEFRYDLKEASTVVFQLLMQCHQLAIPKDERTQRNLFKCFGSWLALGCFPSKEVAESHLLKLAFERLMAPDTSDDMHEALTDCLCNTVYTAGDMTNQLPLAEACFQFVTSVLPPAFKQATQEDNMSKCISYARLFTEMGEAFLDVILTNPGQGAGDLKTLELVISCVEHPSYEVAEVTFYFWYRFAECLDQVQEDNLIEKFKPYLERLIFQLVKQCQLPQDQDGCINMKDEFQDFRLRVLDLIHDLISAAGSRTMFAKVFESMETVKADTKDWTKLEAHLFAMNPFARFIQSTDETCGKVYQVILTLPPESHVQVLHTAMVLAGDMAHWIQHHIEYLDPDFQFLLNGFKRPDLSQMSAVSIHKMCVNTSPKMAHMFSVLLEVSNAVDQLNLEPGGVIDLLSGCAMVLSHLPQEMVTEALMRLCQKHVEQLHAIAHSPTATDPVIYLDRLACIFRNVTVTVGETEEHPCMKVIEKIWDIFKQICKKYKADDRIMERHFRCIRFSIRCVGQGFARLMPSLVEMMVTIYGEYPHSCFLYLGSILVDEYGSNKSVEVPLVQMLRALTQPTFNIFAKGSITHAMVQHPDMVDDFFRLCIRFLQKVTIPFLEFEAIDNMVELAIAGTNLNHREANLSIMKFLSEIVKCTKIENDKPEFNEKPKRISLVQNLLGKHGQGIVKGLIAAVTGGIEPYMLPECGDVLFELLTFCHQPTAIWLKEVLTGLPPHSASGMVYATPDQIMQFYNNITNVTSQRKVYEEFRSFSRLYK